MNVSKHAKRRMQQRAIPPVMLDLLLRYGREELSGDGTIVFLDKKARQRVLRDLKNALSRFDHLGDAYLVESNLSGQVMTVGHRTRRVRRH